MLINLPRIETVVADNPEWASIIGTHEKFQNIGTGTYLHNGFNSGMWIARAYDEDFDIYRSDKEPVPELIIGQAEYDSAGNPLQSSMPIHSYLEFDIDKMRHTSNIILAKYGVCDNPTQVMEWPEMAAALANPDRLYAVVFTILRSQDQHPTGGWRWHKWGEYVGVQNPQCEYLYDEPEIDTVYIYHVHDVTSLKEFL